MGQIVCQACGKTIDYYDAEKVTVLYGKCMNCHDHDCQCDKH